MISILYLENVEPINIIGLAGQRNKKSLDSCSSTATEQQKDMSLKLSSYIDSCEVRNKPVLESQIPTPRTVPSEMKMEENLFIVHWSCF